jgi:hypothetical protein
MKTTEMSRVKIKGHHFLVDGKVKILWTFLRLNYVIFLLIA